MSPEIWTEYAQKGGSLPGDYVERHLVRNERFRVHFDKQPPRHYADFETCEIEFTDRVEVHLTTGLPALYYPERLCGALKIVERFVNLYPGIRGVKVAINLGDSGNEDRTMSYSSRFPSAALIPDPDFVLSNAYAAEKRKSEGLIEKWQQRQPLAYWRGTDSGVGHYEDFKKAPRVLIAMLSRRHPEIIDARITNVEPRANEMECRAFYQNNGLMTGFEPPETMLNYQYQIDIDGNSNAWRGLFLKLISGSPVFKVESEFGFKQWYYDQLKPWINFVPLAPDLSDCVDKMNFLRGRPEMAESIARNARVLAVSMTYDAQLDLAAASMLKFAYGL